MKTNIALILVTWSILMITSCKKDKSNTIEDTIISNEKTYSIPTTYDFNNNQGNSTVDFSGQSQRMEMLTEMITYMKSANTIGVQIDAVILKNMFANNSYTWNDPNSLGLNSTTKQLKDKCAEGDIGIINLFESYMDSIAFLSSLNDTGFPGKSGIYLNDGLSSGKGPYLMNSKGIQYAEWIEKGMMGAVFYNQITSVYLGDSKMNVDNTTPVDSINGKYYTTMEHHWDEAFGYFTYAVNFPSLGIDKFFGKYSNAVNLHLESNAKIMNAFLKGRAAISNKDIPTRNAQITILRNEIEKVIAASAIHYINDALSDISRATNRNHFLSEATGFIDALRYGYNSIEGISLSSSEINSLLQLIGSDFNNVAIQNLQSVKNTLSQKFGFDNFKDLL